MSNEVVVKFSESTSALGEKGRMACTGVTVFKSMHPWETIHIMVIDDKGHAGKCYVEIPIADIPALTEALQKYREG